MYSVYPISLRRVQRILSIFRIDRATNLCILMSNSLSNGSIKPLVNSRSLQVSSKFLKKSKIVFLSTQADSFIKFFKSSQKRIQSLLKYGHINTKWYKVSDSRLESRHLSLLSARSVL